MAFSEGTNYETEFAGQKKFVYIEVSPDSASGNITLGDYTYAVPVGAVFTEALASTCIQLYAEQNSTTTNQIDIALYNTSGTSATSYKDFRLAIVAW